MIEKKDLMVDLCTKYFHGDLTPEDDSAFQQLLSENEQLRDLVAQLTDDIIMEEKMQAFAQSERPDIWNEIQKKLNPGINGETKPRAVVRRKPTMAAAVAATVLVILGTIGYFIYTNKGNQKQEQRPPVAQADPPSSKYDNKAELVSVTGEKILLHTKPNGRIITQGAFQVLKNFNDLYYVVDSSLSSAQELFNKIITYNGSNYRIIFPDGSAIAMNVASSIEFGVSSLSSLRQVKVNGEAEFSIAHDAANPFMVDVPLSNKSGSTGRIIVTGTRFNVNAYDDDDDKTVTLLDGRLKVFTVPYNTEPTIVSHADEKVLKRGDQAMLQSDGNIVIRHNVDTAEVIGWKNDTVYLNRVTTRKMLNTLVRRYDVEVDYETKQIPDWRYTGMITPETDIETMLDIMQFQCKKLHLKYDSVQKKITVLP